MQPDAKHRHEKMCGRPHSRHLPDALHQIGIGADIAVYRMSDLIAQLFSRVGGRLCARDGIAKDDGRNANRCKERQPLSRHFTNPLGYPKPRLAETAPDLPAKLADIQ
jgi:hypothetical protein